MIDLITFLLRVSEQDLFWYLTFEVLIYKHYHSEWECNRLSDKDLIRYQTYSKNIWDKYTL